MLLELIQQDKVITVALVIIAIIWAYVLFRNIRMGNKTANQFEIEYDKILNAKDYKVKGRFEE